LKFMKKNRLKIAMIASNVIRIPPDPPKKYVPSGWSGAPEIIIYFLTEELIRRGHDVTLFASSDSKTKAQLKSVCKSTYLLGKLNTHREYENVLVSKAYQMAGLGYFDIIHSHFDTRTAHFAPLVSTPTISTLHSPLDEGGKKNILKHYKKTQYYASISNHQRKAMPDLQYAVTAYNGIEINKIPFFEKKDNYLIFVGRISKKKGVLEAIEVAKRSGFRLFIFGSAKNDEYWKKVEKQIDGKQIVYKGMASRITVFKYLANASAFIFPLQWEEPFGLVAVEAMATGTPPITFWRGSMPEIIDNGKNGFLVDNLSQMVAAVKKVKLIDPKLCRKKVEEFFTIEKMVDRYEEAYYKIINNNLKG